MAFGGTPTGRKTITPTYPQHHLALPTGDPATTCRSHVEVDALTVQPDPTTGFAFEIWMHIKIMI